MAKPGGKVGGKGKEKRTDQRKNDKRAKPGKAPKPGRSDKARPAKPKRPKGAQRLVERVAKEIVIAEFDRAVNGSAAEGAVGQEPSVQETPVQETHVEETSVREASVRVREGSRQEGAEAEAPGEEQAADEGGGIGGTDEDDAGSVSDLLRLPAGPVDLAGFDTAATPGVSSREKADAQLPKLAARLGELQERLFAAARGGDSNRKVLLVLQGMDTAGKGGTVRHVVGQLDPNGIRVTAFKAPTEEERAHDFLWRIRNALPRAGEVGIFDRSHYEDVLIARVHKLALPMNIGKRYQLINRFEQGLVDDGTVLVKCFLHISPDEQRTRLLARLDDPVKHWKYSPADVDERALWPEYQEAYRLALEKCSTEDAPWYVVPADRKWYRNYAITRLLIEALERIDPLYPPGAFDVEVERKRLLAS